MRGPAPHQVGVVLASSGSSTEGGISGSTVPDEDALGTRAYNLWQN